MSSLTRLLLNRILKCDPYSHFYVRCKTSKSCFFLFLSRHTFYKSPRINFHKIELKCNFTIKNYVNSLFYIIILIKMEEEK